MPDLFFIGQQVQSISGTVVAADTAKVIVQWENGLKDTYYLNEGKTSFLKMKPQEQKTELYDTISIVDICILKSLKVILQDIVRFRLDHVDAESQLTKINELLKS